MIEKLVVTKKPNKYSTKIFDYSHHYEPTEFTTVEELMSFHNNCKDYAITYSGANDTISIHFPAHIKGRTIYRTKFDKKINVGIYTFSNPQYKNPLGG